MASLITTAKARTIAYAIQQYTGVKPRVVFLDDYAQISFAAEDQKRLSAYLLNELNKKRSPGDVRIDYRPVISPVITRKAMPYLLGAACAGLILGRFL